MQLQEEEENKECIRATHSVLSTNVIKRIMQWLKFECVWIWRKLWNWVRGKFNMQCGWMCVDADKLLLLLLKNRSKPISGWSIKMIKL